MLDDGYQNFQQFCRRSLGVIPRRKMLNFLGLSAMNALFAVGCKRFSQKGQVDVQPLPNTESDALGESIPQLQVLEFKTAQVNAQGQIISEPMVHIHMTSAGIHT